MASTVDLHKYGLSKFAISPATFPGKGNNLHESGLFHRNDSACTSTNKLPMRAADVLPSIASVSSPTPHTAD
jgi:hypothetical protein